MQRTQTIPTDAITADGLARRAAGAPITDVIFDFGNVLVFWKPELALVSRYSPRTIDAFLDNSRSGFTDANDMMDAGKTSEQTIEWMRSHYGEKYAAILRFYCDHFIDSLAGPVPGSRMLVNDLKTAGIRVWGLSNWSSETFPIAWSRYEVLHQLRSKVVSGPIGIRKPSREIFEYALRSFGIDARTTIFIDDKSENVIGANSAGIRAVRFADPYRLRRLLIDAGIRIPGVA